MDQACLFSNFGSRVGTAENALATSLNKIEKVEVLFNFNIADLQLERLMEKSEHRSL